MRARKRELMPIGRFVLELSAEIIGPHGAAAQALERADEIGPDAEFYLSGDTIVVVDPKACTERGER